MDKAAEERLFKLAESGKISVSHLDGIDLTALLNCGHTLMVHAVQSEMSGNLCRVILQKSPDLLWTKLNGSIVLHTAGNNRNLKVVRQLLETKWVKDRSGDSALYNSRFSSMEIIRSLMSTKRMVITSSVSRQKLKFMIDLHDGKEETTQDIFPLTFFQL